MPLTNLSDVHVEQSPTETVSSQKIINYFKLILKILVGFILFCWTSTSNYLNSLHINTDETYPVFDKTNKGGMNNPYATRFNPGPIDMSNEKSIKEKVGMLWWFERTQQSSYQVGGLILHSIFNFFKGQMKDSNHEDTDKPKSTLLQFFSFLKWFIFGILSNLTFILLLMLVFLLWIPGFLGGLTAFMPLTYYTASPILKLAYKGLILFGTFIWMCIMGWITFFPVIYGFLHLLYLMLFKQLKDSDSRFVDQFMKRMKQLIYIYITVAFIIAVSSKDLPQETKTTVATVLVVSLIYAAYKRYQSTKNV